MLCTSVSHLCLVVQEIWCTPNSGVASLGIVYQIPGTSNPLILYLSAAARPALFILLIYSPVLCWTTFDGLVALFRAEVTGITPNLLAQKNARPFREIWPQFASWLTTIAPEGGRGLVLATHQAHFHRGFVAKAIARAAIDRYTRLLTPPL